MYEFGREEGGGGVVGGWRVECRVWRGECGGEEGA